MSLNREFMQLLKVEIKDKDLLILHKYLVDFKNRGMDEESMLGNLEELRNQTDSDMEDVLLDLMDYVTGFCSPHMAIYC